MTIFEGAILGLVQGITEFLPVSSTGHLILMREALGLAEGGLAFDAALHLGTLVAVCIFFRRELGVFIQTLWKFVTRAPIAPDDAGFCAAVVWGTVPAVALALLFKDMIELHARGSAVVAGGLIIGSLIMFFAERYASRRGGAESRESKKLSARIGFRIGMFQALALIPGMSRSGATISGGLMNGLSREDATRFAFILSFPILIAAGGISFVSLALEPVGSASLAPLFAGLITAGVSGFLAIRFLVSYLKRHTLNVFIWYRVVLAAVILLFFV